MGGLGHSIEGLEEIALALEEDCQRLREALCQIGRKRSEALDIMRQEGFVIANLKDRWQKLAFTFYTMLAAVEELAECALMTQVGEA